MTPDAEALYKAAKYDSHEADVERWCSMIGRGGLSGEEARDAITRALDELVTFRELGAHLSAGGSARAFAKGWNEGYDTAAASAAHLRRLER